MEKNRSRFDSHLERAKHAARFVFEHLPVSDFGRSSYPRVNVHERVEDLVSGKYPFEQDEGYQPKLDLLNEYGEVLGD